MGGPSAVYLAAMTSPYRDLDRLRPGALFALLFTGPVLGGLLGAATNAVSAAVSPEYFRTVLGWHTVVDVWRAGIAQGVFEGILGGLGFAIVFTVLVGIISKGCCPYALALRYLLAVAAFAAGTWLLGGLVAIGLATLSPEFFRHAFQSVPVGTGPMLRYAWVGGSIWGIELGGLAALVAGCVALGTRWRRLARTLPWQPGMQAEDRCPRCGYIVKGLSQPRCPECGTDLRDVGVQRGV